MSEQTVLVCAMALAHVVDIVNPDEKVNGLWLVAGRCYRLIRLTWPFGAMEMVSSSFGRSGRRSLRRLVGA